MKFMEKIIEKGKELLGISPEQELVNKAYSLFDEFSSAYASEWQRLEHCDQYYRGDQWDDIPMTDAKEPRPVTNIVLSTVENIKADIMDNFPEAIITPETPGDERTARILEALIRQNHDATSYNREYQGIAHDLLVGGYGCQEIGYDPLLNSGIGGAFIRYVDARNILFDPQCTDIQDGRAVFKIGKRTIKWLEQQYPQYAGRFRQDGYSLQEDTVLTQDQTKSLLLIEYWWREYDADSNVFRVHMAKLAGRNLLEDSRERKPEGYFAHGKYPFNVTTLFKRKGSALGFGIVDAFGGQQLFADKLDQIVMKNALMASHVKLLNTEASGFDSDDLADWSKEVHTGENLNGVKWFETPPLPQYILTYIQSMRQNVKEESGANEFSRGGTASGVTAASAIAALQEMSSKRSRMASRQLHEGYRDAVRMEIEVEREFNLLPRQVLLQGDKGPEADTFESSLLQHEGPTGTMIPIEFSISIKVQRENRWNVMAHNELILQMVKLGMLTPTQAVELMHFDGRESVLKKSAEAKQVQPVSPEQAQAMQAQQQMAAAMQQVPSPEQAIH